MGLEGNLVPSPRADKVLKLLSGPDVSKSSPNTSTCISRKNLLSKIFFFLLTLRDKSTAYWKHIWVAFFFFLQRKHKEASPAAIQSGSCSAEHTSGGEQIYLTFHHADLKSAGKRADRHLCSWFKSKTRAEPASKVVLTFCQHYCSPPSITLGTASLGKMALGIAGRPFPTAASALLQPDRVLSLWQPTGTGFTQWQELRLTIVACAWLRAGLLCPRVEKKHMEPQVPLPCPCPVTCSGCKAGWVF